MCTATVDTQTAGDVLRPASYNGVVGYKPTVGWAPVHGVQPVAATIDTLGVMARRVIDAATVAAAAADHSSRFAVPPPPSRPAVAVLADDEFVRATGPGVRSNLTDVTHRLADAGAVIDVIASPVDLAIVHAAHRLITFSECATHHLSRYRIDGDRYGARARGLIDLGLITPAHAYIAAQDLRRHATSALARRLEDVDVLLLPVTSRPAPPRDTTGDSALQIPWTLCGFPAVALPTGLDEGLPLGVQLVAAPHRDGELLAVGRWCEDVLDVHLHDRLNLM